MFRVSLCFLFLATSLPIQAKTESAPASVDCHMCGHACCCPEVCAAELKAQREAQSCDQPETACRIESSRDNFSFAEANFSEIRIRPAAERFDARFFEPNHQYALRRSNKLILTSSPIKQIPTPPPRSV
jgi:hypothetical protein